MSNGALTLEEQMEWAKSTDWVDRVSFASYPAVLPEVADFMIENEKTPSILDIICKRLFEQSNSNIQSSTLAKAARKKVELCGVNHDFDDALINIALHLNTDVDTLKYLFELGNKHVNWGLANNPNTPRVILAKLADMEIFDIDDALLFNPNATEETLQKLGERYKEGFFSCGYYYDHQGIKVVASGN